MAKILTHNLGYPRIGEQRELKKAIESYWNGEMTVDALDKVGQSLRWANWQKQHNAGIDLIPCGDFSFYDHVLETTCMVGNVPPRFGWDNHEVSLDVQFLIARGQLDRECFPGEGRKECQEGQSSPYASEMTKWFDTNYHYIVPEFSSRTEFCLASYQIIKHYNEARSLGINAKAVLIGPTTYLTLGKVQDKENPDFNRFELFEKLLPVYVEVLLRLKQSGAEWVQIDEPILATDLSDEQKGLVSKTYTLLRQAVPDIKILLATYFGELRDNLDLAVSLDCHGLHVDVVRAAKEVITVAKRLPADRTLSLGVVNGRNIWKTDLCAALQTIESVRILRPESDLWLAPSCSLLHVPITLRNELDMPPQLRRWLAFADEKLAEVSALRDLALGQGDRSLLERNQVDLLSRRSCPNLHNPAVHQRLETLTANDYTRLSPFKKRQQVQKAKLNLPLFPTTTIGSFPQTQDIRATRAKWKKGQLSDVDYETFIEEKIRQCVDFQNKIGIDMLVHGEFERNDMVEYFAEQLEGFAITSNGWVQSYGTRYVKPPLIFGDVFRPRPMTTRWLKFAQSLTRKPMKGMLTGPVTLLQWSFVRDDQPRDITARQIALAIRDEVADLERIGLAAIQIDEPAFREGLPLRKSDWGAYLRWAVDAFRLCASVARDDTQIHTHMCYSEFNDIIQSIAELDADVITIETSRSNMELLDAFGDFLYPAEIGPGVYDIHSPRVPTVKEMKNLMAKAQRVLPAENLWINPDCGLKTRRWEQVRLALAHMVQTAHYLRQQIQNRSAHDGTKTLFSSLDEQKNFGT